MRILVLGRKDIAKVEDIVTALQHLGHEVDFVLFRGFHYTGGQTSYSTSIGEIPVRPNTSRKGYYFWNFFQALSFLRKNFREKHFDTILAIDWFEGVIALCYLYLFARQARVIFYSYDFYFFDSIFSSRYLINRIDRFVATHVDEVWNVTGAIGKERARQGVKVKNSKTVPLGITRKADGWVPKSTKHFLFVGNFKTGHNLLRLVEVFAELQKTDPAFELTLVGKGNQEPLLREAIQKYALEDAVHMRGFVSEAELLEEIRQGRYAAGIAVYEKTREITCADPGKIKDYLSWGLPVMTTDTNVMAEDIRQYDLGVVADVDDVATLCGMLRGITVESIQEWQENIKQYVETRSFEAILGKNLR